MSDIVADFRLMRHFVLTTFKTVDDGIGLFAIQSAAGQLAEDEGLATRKKQGPQTHSGISWDFDECTAEAVWDLILDRVLVQTRLWEGGPDSPRNPWFRLTEYGKAVIQAGQPSHYDPDGYVARLKSFAPNLDEVIEQYVVEGLNCFRQSLIFAAAVMLGAAAEKAVYLLLEAMGKAETDPQGQKKVAKLSEPPRLPAIFEYIRRKLDDLVTGRKVIPYDVHEGSSQHLTSLFEMIRVQRNDAVHPAAGKCERLKALSMTHSLPPALELTYRLINWFKANRI